MSEAKNENKADIASERGEDNAADNTQAEDQQQASSTGKQSEPNKISDDVEASDIGSTGQQGNGHPPKKPGESKLTVPAGTQGESSLYYNPKHTAYSRVGESVQKINGKKKSWADAAREDDMMRGNYYDSYLQHMAALNGDDAVNEMIRKNPELAQQLHQMNMADGAATAAGSTGGSGATEEEKAARRERIRARKEEKLRTGGDKSFEDASADPKYYQTADGTVKKLPAFAREEFLESIKEGGVPIKSWLIIALAMGIGIYQLRKTTQQTESKGNKRQGGASHAKTRVTNKANLGKKKRQSATAPEVLEPELDFELDPEPKRGPKQLKKNKSSKKKRVRKPTASSIIDTYHDSGSQTDDSPSFDAADNDTTLATPSSGTANVSSSDTATDELELKSYNEDDRRAIMQVLSEEDGDGANLLVMEDNDGWVTAGRKSKGAKKHRSPQTSPSVEEPKASSANTSEGAKESASLPKGAEKKVLAPTNDIDSASSEPHASSGSEEKKRASAKTKTAAPNSKMALPKSKFTPPSSSSQANPSGPKPQPSPKPIDTKEEDAALARKLQKQEENMAARELGFDVEEEWEEVSPKKKGRKANLAQPSTAISAS